MKRIYVAEDQPAQAELLKTVFQKQAQYQVTFFNSGLELYRTTLQVPPDLLILDILLPVVNGLAITHLLKHHDEYRSIPIIVVSSITDADIESRVVHDGADVFLPKPFQMAALLDAVRRLLEAPSAIVTSDTGL